MPLLQACQSGGNNADDVGGLGGGGAGNINIAQNMGGGVGQNINNMGLPNNVAVGLPTGRPRTGLPTGMKGAGAAGGGYNTMSSPLNPSQNSSHTYRSLAHQTLAITNDDAPGGYTNRRMNGVFILFILSLFIQIIGKNLL